MLKGGSLSTTVAHTSSEDNGFVRKTVDLSVHREYGFTRWCSQLKKQQRLHQWYPDLFPRVLRFGKQGHTAFFDMPFYKDMIDGYSFVSQSTDEDAIDVFLQQIIWGLRRLHKVQYSSNPEGITLFFYEEITKKLQESAENSLFHTFTSEETIWFNGEAYPCFHTQISLIKTLFHRSYKALKESVIHGNSTLENILYNPNTGQIMFIDVYEENVLDTPLLDYAQLFQSCHGCYEQYNSMTPVVEQNYVTCKTPRNQGLSLMKSWFETYMDNNLTMQQQECIRLFEISRFIHMLPFKINSGQAEKACLFYGLASKLLSEFLRYQQRQKRGIA